MRAFISRAGALRTGGLLFAALLTPQPLLPQARLWVAGILDTGSHQGKRSTL